LEPETPFSRFGENGVIIFRFFEYITAMQPGLYLKFALNLEHLADEMIKEISKRWTDPFNAPVVIFPDPKLEQWFRLRWVQKKGVLANLNRTSIDQFLLNILVGEDNTRKKLNSDLLANVIISYLQQKTDGEFNYNLLGESVKSYLESNGALDENRLFDFANVMAGLFLEYETSRPNGFIYDSETADKAKGILDCWKQNAPKDFFITHNGTAAANESWQRKLYSALFHDGASGKSLLNQVFEKCAEKNGKKITYLTLPYLYEACKDKNGKAIFHYDSDLPVFIFGLSGMGHFYRVILQEFSSQHEVYAFIQNPCMAFWEDCSGTRKPTESMRVALPGLATDPYDESEFTDENENELLCHWGKAGRDNIKLWSIATDYNFIFDEESIADRKKEIPCDSLLHQVQWTIANRKNTFSENSDIIRKIPFEKDCSFSVTTAPSKIREVEALHSRICKLLSEKDPQGNPKATVADVLVVSPNIDDYRTAIFQVFDQTREGFHIPFNIVDSATHDSLTANALNILLSIREKGTLSRPDFFALVRNPVVQNVRNIHADEISDWESWVSNMNIYRDRTVEDNGELRREESWITATRRLLLSRFCYGDIHTDRGDISPYSDISSANDLSLYRFVDAIDSLENWMALGTDGITESNFSTIYQFLDSWLCMVNPPKELMGESIIYHSVSSARENLDYQYLAGSETISLKCISQTLMHAARGSEYSCGHLFINGLTFMKFAPNRIIPTKYLFFIGADAANFPGVRNTNTLDLRKSCRPWPGDDSIVSRNRYAFLCQLMSTSEGFFISYVNKDLQKDEEFYPSSIVNDIRVFLRNVAKSAGIDDSDILKRMWPNDSIPLDESRPWEMLFTRREIRNKNAHLDFGTDHSIVNFTPDINNEDSSRPPEQVDIYQIKKFLSDPFEFRVGEMMYFKDQKENPEKTEFEPLSIDKLQQSQLQRMLVAQKLGVFENDYLTTEKDIFSYALSRGILPKGALSTSIWENVRDSAIFFVQTIEGYYDRLNYQYGKRSIELQMNGWTLLGQIPLFAQNTHAIHLIATVSSISQRHFLSPYIQALALICEFGQKSEAVPDITIECISTRNREVKQIKQTPEQATELLENLYQKMFVEQTCENGKRYSKVIPIDFISNDDIQTYDDYIKAFGNKNTSPWTYFAGRKLFDIEKVCGFTEEDFSTLWPEETETIKNLTPDLWDSEDNMEEDINASGL